MDTLSMTSMCAAGSWVKPLSCAPCPYAFRACHSRASRRRRRTASCVAGNASALKAHTRRGLLGAAALLSVSVARPGWAAEKQAMPVDELKRLLMRDFQQRQYYITGQITPSVFADDCVFVDPTTNVKGPEMYSRAVASLFDPQVSRADLISAEVLDPHTLRFRWRFDATLRSPIRLKFKPYTGTTLYRTNADGLIAEHLETWDISAADAFMSALIPSFGAPPAPPVDPLPL